MEWVQREQIAYLTQTLHIRIATFQMSISVALLNQCGQLKYILRTQNAMTRIISSSHHLKFQNLIQRPRKSRKVNKMLKKKWLDRTLRICLTRSTSWRNKSRRTMLIWDCWIPNVKTITIKLRRRKIKLYHYNWKCRIFRSSINKMGPKWWLK